MAKGSQDNNQTDSDLDTPKSLANVTPSPSPMMDHSFTLQAVMDLKGTQGTHTQAIAGLTQSINRQDQQLSKIDDLRVGVGKLETRITNLSTELNSVRSKLDEIRIFVAGAGAVIGLISLVMPMVARMFIK